MLPNGIMFSHGACVDVDSSDQPVTFKHLAWRYGTALKGSDVERRALAALIAAVQDPPMPIARAPRERDRLRRAVATMRGVRCDMILIDDPHPRVVTPQPRATFDVHDGTVTETTKERA